MCGFTLVSAGAMNRRAEPNDGVLFWTIVFMGILAGMAFVVWVTHPELR